MLRSLSGLSLTLVLFVPVFCKKSEPPRTEFAVIGTGVRLRTEAGTHGKVLGQLNKGERVQRIETAQQEETIGGKKGRWMKVQTSDGRIGWIFSAFLSEVKAETVKAKGGDCLRFESGFPGAVKEGWLGENGQEGPPRTVLYPDGRAEIVYDYHRGIMDASWKKHGTSIVVIGAYKDLSCELGCMGCSPDEACRKCENDCRETRLKNTGKSEVVFDVEYTLTLNKDQTISSAVKALERNASPGKSTQFPEARGEKNEGCLHPLTK